MTEAVKGGKRLERRNTEGTSGISKSKDRQGETRLKLFFLKDSNVTMLLVIPVSVGTCVPQAVHL